MQPAKAPTRITITYLTSKGITGPQMSSMPDALPLSPEQLVNLDSDATTLQVINLPSVSD